MAEDRARPAPRISRLAEAILPDTASDAEQADFARGIAILAELLGEVEESENGCRVAEARS